ncbi:MAG: mannonate dehydratase [Chloroflexi bacterium]|nr:mannonate dehydratase [Chloroflexota bacterium]
MRIASVLTPISDHHLTLARQVGITDIIIRYPGLDYDKLARLKEHIESFGLQVPVVEGYLPMEEVKLGTAGSATEIEQIKTLICNMGRAGIPILCYHFMAGSDWSRTSFTERERGGALVSSFDIAKIAALPLAHLGQISQEQLWANLQGFLAAVLPVAEAAGVTMAMHPDDPPIAALHGLARIMYTVESYERLVSMIPSPRNTICFCQGTFAEMGVDIPATIRRLGAHISYVHFRDVRGGPEKFVETFHDNGQTDMVAAMRAYRDIGFQGPMRPDHVPQLAGEEEGEPGYTMLGRLYAAGYMRGLIQAVTSEV